MSSATSNASTVFNAACYLDPTTTVDVLCRYFFTIDIVYTVSHWSYSCIPVPSDTWFCSLSPVSSIMMHMCISVPMSKCCHCCSFILPVLLCSHADVAAVA